VHTGNSRHEQFSQEICRQIAVFFFHDSNTSTEYPPLPAAELFQIYFSDKGGSLHSERRARELLIAAIFVV